ncbi:hypothetical protein SALBM217S_00767 [Streptomyces griseoloalbus]
MVFSRAVPIAPPTCCEVFTIAEATPESRGSTPRVASDMAGMNAVPMPRPSSSMPGSSSSGCGFDVWSASAVICTSALIVSLR